jgi:membrane protein implicated in regulation of membrane protease activity
MENILSYFGPWTWFIIGAALLLLELLAPGVVFVWLGLAAIGVGLIDYVFSMSWQMELVVFSVLSVVFLIVGRPIVSKRLAAETDQPNLNQRNQEFVGKTYKLTEPLKDGHGALVINDTRWRIRGADMAKGAWVKVTSVDGLELVVEAV